MSDINSLIYSSAVLCLSPSTEVARNRTVDAIVIERITSKGLDIKFTVEEIYHSLQEELPLRFKEVENSIQRGLKNDNFEIVTGDSEYIDSAVLKLSTTVKSQIKAESGRIHEYLHEASRELFEDVCSEIEPTRLENCLLDCVSRLMAKYGYAYAGQMVGILEASDFVPLDVLKEVCQSVLTENNISGITVESLMEAIGILFDRRDPALNNLAFCLCQKYYSSRLIGLDIPIDFLSSQIYKDSTIYFDTNFVFTVALSGPQRYKEFKEVLRFAPDIGITFAVTDLTIAESLAQVDKYRELFEKGEDSLPDALLEEAQEDVLSRDSVPFTIAEKQSVMGSRSAGRLKKMGVRLIELDDSDLLIEGEELSKMKSELHEFDRKYRKLQPKKDDNALYHDAQLCNIIINHREKKNKPTSAWFLTNDNSIVAHGIHIKKQEVPPYSIKLMTLLNTLSPFVESQALKLEFAGLFMELVSKDLLPRKQIFSVDDLKMFVGFDMKAKAMPPEFVRKGMAHIKKEILKGGGLTEENKPAVLYEFTKYMSLPAEHFVELQRRYESKIQARDKALEQKNAEISDLKTQYDKAKEGKNHLAILLLGIFCSVILWMQYPNLYVAIAQIVTRPLLISIGIQLAVISAMCYLLFPRNARLIAISGSITTAASIIAGLA